LIGSVSNTARTLSVVSIGEGFYHIDAKDSA